MCVCVCVCECEWVSEWVSETLDKRFWCLRFSERPETFVLFLSLSKRTPNHFTLLLLRWHYSPGWALASFTIRLQASQSLALSLHSFIPIFGFITCIYWHIYLLHNTTQCFKNYLFPPAGDNEKIQINIRYQIFRSVPPHTTQQAPNYENFKFILPQTKNQNTLVADRHTFTYMEYALQTDIERLKFWSAATWNYESVTLVARELGHDALTYVRLMTVTQEKIRGSHMSAKQTYIPQHVHSHIAIYRHCCLTVCVWTHYYHTDTAV